MAEEPGPHIPDLEKLEGLNDVELQFYGLIGALVSLVAGLEHRSFKAFQIAKDLDEEGAAAEFYRKRDISSARRKRADEAMQARLNGAALNVWNELYGRWAVATNDSAPRHLISHNQVKSIEQHVGGIFDPAVFDEAVFDTGRVELDLIIKQDDFQVMANIRQAARADVADLLRNCREVASLLSDIDKFLLELKS